MDTLPLAPVGTKRRSMKAVAFVAVVFSTVSMFVAVVTLPFVYNYVQSVQTIMQQETDYCRVREDELPSFVCDL